MLQLDHAQTRMPHGDNEPTGVMCRPVSRGVCSHFADDELLE
jgi:hypothetical protein